MAVSEYALVTLAEVKDFMGMKGSTSDADDLIEDLINRVSVLFESYLNRKILSRDWLQFIDGKGLSVLFPDQPMITSVSGIWDDSEWLWEDVDLIPADEYRIVDNSYIAFRTTTTLGNYEKNIKLLYTAGYDETPDDLKQACITEISRMYKNRNQVDILSKSLSDGSVTMVAQDFLPLTITTLNKYKRIITV